MNQPPVTAIVSGDDIARTCLHVRIKFEKIGNSRKVKTSQIDVRGETETSKTDKTMIRVSKQLLDSPELKKITEADTEIKKYLDLVCLPFDAGVRLVPKVAVEQVTQKLRTFKAKRELLVQSFVQCYDIERERARVRLGPLFDPRDYPPTEDVAREFGFSYQYVNFGAPSELREINPSIFAEEREKTAAALESAAVEIKQLMRATLAEMIERLKTALTPTDDGKKRRLYDTTVTNLQEFLSTFNLRNVTNDTELAALVEKARSVIAGVNPDSLRDTETLRLNVQKGMEEVSQLIQPLVVTVTRKFRFDETTQ